MRLLAALVLLAALLAPVASAQLPTAPQGCAIAADPPTAPTPLSEPGTRVVTLSVRNPGSVPANVEVAAVVNEAGWTIDQAPEGAVVAAGATGRFDVVVRAQEGAAATATVLLTANGVCEGPAGPIAGCTVCQSTANQQVTVSYQAPTGLPGLGNLGFPIEYLVAGVLLVAVATAVPLALRGRRSPRGRLAADCPEPLKMLKAGRGTSFPIELRNAADAPAQASFEVAPVPEGWSAFMPLPEVQLAARESRSLWLMVRSPPDAKPGAAADIELRMRMPDGVELAPVRVRAEVNEA